MLQAKVRQVEAPKTVLDPNRDLLKSRQMSWTSIDTPSMQYQQWTQTARGDGQHVEYSTSYQWTHNLELEGNDSKVEYLYGRP